MRNGPEKFEKTEKEDTKEKRESFYKKEKKDFASCELRAGAPLLEPELREHAKKRERVRFTVGEIECARVCPIEMF